MGVGVTALGMEVSVGNGVSRGNGVEVGLVTGGGLVAIAVGRKVGGGAEVTVTVTVAVGASFWVGGWVGVPPPQAKTPRDINVAPVVRQSFALRPNLNSLFLKKMK